MKIGDFVKLFQAKYMALHQVLRHWDGKSHPDWLHDVGVYALVRPKKRELAYTEVLHRPSGSTRSLPTNQ
eukprot:8200160-Lingulodinium_polyedra.AAC.1